MGTIIRQAGYSLVELVVVVALLGMLTLGAVSLFYSTLKGSSKSSVLASVKQQGDYAMVTLERIIRNGVTATCNDTSTQVTIDFPDNATQRVVEVVDGRLTLDGVDLIGSEMVVTESNIVCISGDRVKPDQVELEFTVRKGVAGVNRAEEIFEQSFRSMVSLRNY